MRDCPGLTLRDLNAVIERDVRAGCGLLVAERVVDRVPCALGAFCASLRTRRPGRQATIRNAHLRLVRLGAPIDGTPPTMDASPEHCGVRLVQAVRPGRC